MGTYNGSSCHFQGNSLLRNWDLGKSTFPSLSIHKDLATLDLHLVQAPDDRLSPGLGLHVDKRPSGPELVQARPHVDGRSSIFLHQSLHVLLCVG